MRAREQLTDRQQKGTGLPNVSAYVCQIGEEIPNFVFFGYIYVSPQLSRSLAQSLARPLNRSLAQWNHCGFCLRACPSPRIARVACLRQCRCGARARDQLTSSTDRHRAAKRALKKGTPNWLENAKLGIFLFSLYFCEYLCISPPRTFPRWLGVDERDLSTLYIFVLPLFYFFLSSTLPSYGPDCYALV